MIGVAKAELGDQILRVVGDLRVRVGDVSRRDVLIPAGKQSVQVDRHSLTPTRQMRVRC